MASLLHRSRLFRLVVAFVMGSYVWGAVLFLFLTDEAPQFLAWLISPLAVLHGFYLGGVSVIAGDASNAMPLLMPLAGMVWVYLMCARLGRRWARRNRLDEIEDVRGDTD